MPVRIHCGVIFLYPFAVGFRAARSNTSLNLYTPRLSFSNRSLLVVRPGVAAQPAIARTLQMSRILKMEDTNEDDAAVRLLAGKRGIRLDSLIGCVRNRF